MTEHHDRKIDYVELPSTDIAKSKTFFSAVFGWTYQDWGPEYADTSDGRITTGLSAAVDRPRSPLVTFYAEDLEQTRARILAAGGRMTREIFAFPGGRRFHFEDPSGNELAVWSKAGAAGHDEP